ncbi:unnamed protein product [Urochloa humidicola]
MAARKKLCWIFPGGGADHLTPLPLELRAQIVSSLPFWQVVQLSVLSRPWRHIHHHAPFVKVHLDDFTYPNDYPFLPGVVNKDAILGLRVALSRRACTVSSSTATPSLGARACGATPTASSRSPTRAGSASPSPTPDSA